MIEKLSGQHSVRQTAQTGFHRGASGSAFDAALQQELARQTAQPPQEIAFSKHAISRAEERGIEITPSLIDQIKGSMVRAQAKGATNILAVDTEKAFIINVPNAKVITAITQAEMKDSVFTNIDGAVFL
ncbi:TIGR02530 family flagellar biosynthesis protein [Intestinimonas sp.]|uniref:TIGR02530 family flagellar biosynthesis protein n=1 Tax=Intestinimonas sp. TaxID=1965293 RepID=UPI002606C892|nr:TIGR02530 family flagellar biosynthesis protein [Intestinimonas sp.]